MRPYDPKTQGNERDLTELFLDDAEAFNGAPTAVQIAAPTFQDEICLEAAARVDAILRSSP